MHAHAGLYELRSTEGSRRLYKEHKLYQKEEEDLKRKLDKYIADNAEEWDIKNTVCVRMRIRMLSRGGHADRSSEQRRMLEESGKMIADSASRLGGAVQELRDLLVSPSSTFYSRLSR